MPAFHENLTILPRGQDILASACYAFSAWPCTPPGTPAGVVLRTGSAGILFNSPRNLPRAMASTHGLVAGTAIGLAAASSAYGQPYGYYGYGGPACRWMPRYNAWGAYVGSVRVCGW